MAEAWRDQVLHGFLAQVVIEAEDLLLGEYPADVVVDLARRFEIAAERLFEHDAAARCDESGRAEVLADAGEQARRRREIEHARALVAILERRGEPRIVVRDLGVELHVIEAFAERLPCGFAEVDRKSTV